MKCYTLEPMSLSTVQQTIPHTNSLHTYYANIIPLEKVHRCNLSAIVEVHVCKQHSLWSLLQHLFLLPLCNLHDANREGTYSSVCSIAPVVSHHHKGHAKALRVCVCTARIHRYKAVCVCCWFARLTSRFMALGEFNGFSFSFFHFAIPPFRLVLVGGRMSSSTNLQRCFWGAWAP